MLEKFAPEEEEEEEVPVMDLFTGNLDLAPANIENGAWSNFANLDDAFAAASSLDTTLFDSGSGDEDDAAIGLGQMKPRSSSDAFKSGEKTVEDLFGNTPHDLLLEDADTDDIERVETADEETSNSPDVAADGEPLTISSMEKETKSALSDIPFKNPSEEIASAMLGNEPNNHNNVTNRNVIMVKCTVALAMQGPRSNIADFHAAFDIIENSPTNKPVESCVDVWKRF